MVHAGNLLSNGVIMIEILHKEPGINSEGIQKLPIKSWVTDLEDTARTQAINLANLPFAFKHIALMPDCHMGYGMPIGGVLATKDAIVPNAVGVDIGCGVLAMQTDLHDVSQDDLKKILDDVRKRIPTGFNKHPYLQERASFMPTGVASEIISLNFGNAVSSLGTLGGGNHFIEIQKGSDGFIWVMIHSGSRNLGKQVADYHNTVAQKLNAKYFSAVPKEYELAFLPIGSTEGMEYIADMEYCVQFAKANRRDMLTQLQLSMQGILGDFGISNGIDVAHNYASIERHFGTEVVVHRKGATSAKEGEYCIIPGSQGTKSYIARGKGNRDSFNSCPHGAGRKMGRNEAKRNLCFDLEKKRLDDMGVVHGMCTVNDLDEAAGAYKDITQVMENAQDLCEIQIELTPMCVIKG